MSALRRYGPAALLTLLLALLWVGAVRADGKLRSLPETAVLRYHTEGFSHERLLQMEKSEEKGDERIAFSAFAQLDAQPVESKLYGRTARPDVLLFYGDLRRILPVGLPGSDFVSSDDSEGCALDRETAFSLWGSDRVEGEKLVFEDREYEVRAVYDAPAGTVAIPAARADGHLLTALALSTPPGRDARLTAEAFYARHGLSAPDALTTGDWRDWLTRLLILLPALPLAAVLLFSVARELWGLRHTPVLCAAGVLATAALLALLFYLSGAKLSLPQSMVPTRWSDFEFWKRLFDGWGENLRNGLLTPMLAPDRLANAALGKLVACSLAAAADMTVLIHLYNKGRTV